MQLWILQPIVDENGDSDMYGYDRTFKLIVRAENEQQARWLAADDTKFECALWNDGDELLNSPWNDASKVSCDLVSQDGEPCVVIRDFHAG